MSGRNRKVYFVTENRAKYLEAKQITTAHGVELKHLKLEKSEIQADSLREIAAFAAMEAAKSYRCNVVCEDAGFFVNELNGFPGPYSSYVFRKLAAEGILSLMRYARDRGAFFRSAVAYCRPDERPRCFTGTVRGVIGKKPRGLHGFGFDPIFIPLNGDGRSFAQMHRHEKNMFSHRAKAFAKFTKWYVSPRTRYSS